MDKINYLSNPQVVKSGKFPVTIQGLEFIQKQISDLQMLAAVGGRDCYIVKDSTPVASGLCVFNGEVLPLTGVRNASDTHIHIEKTCQSVYTDNGDYENVREIRVAVYAKHGTDTYRDAVWMPIDAFQPFAANTELLARIEALSAAVDALLRRNQFLPMKRGIYSLMALNEERQAARIFCNAGSYAVGGCNSYTVDVYACAGAKVYQELRTPDLRAYGRYSDSATGVWTDFQPLDEQMQLEAKVIRGTLYLRHGFLPPYARIVLLRKKRRGRLLGPNRKHRSLKCAWFHGYKMEFSTGKPNTWYVPKCTAAKDKGKDVVGKDLSTAISQLLYSGVTVKRPYWSIRGVNKRWKSRQVRRAYARLALAVLTDVAHSMPVNSMLRLKFRVWMDLNNGIRKGISVE